MANAQHAAKPCHNCRRQRWKCDRSLPGCHKCAAKSQPCLGYQRLLRWESGVASRGKMMGRSFPEIFRPRCPTDPFFQDLDHVSRQYLCHFASHVCRDLVLYDVPGHNPFYELLPEAHHCPVIMQSIVAISAMHQHNKSQILQSGWDSSGGSRSIHMVNALTAKQRTLNLLRTSIETNSARNHVILTVALLLIELELLDSGHGHWRRHLQGASDALQSLCRVHTGSAYVKNPLYSTVAANCIMFRIIGSATSRCQSQDSCDVSMGTFALLQDAEGNICTSFPVVLLRLLHSGSELLQTCHSGHVDEAKDAPIYERSSELIQAAKAFEPTTWASEIQRRSPVADLERRSIIAAAHRAATLIFLSRVRAYFCPYGFVGNELQPLVIELLEYLSHIDSKDAMFTATMWPTFIAGLETRDVSSQRLVAQRFRDLWTAEPWGVKKEALRVTEIVWKRRRRTLDMGLRHTVGLAGSASSKQYESDGDWLKLLVEMDFDWLIT